MKRFRWKFKGIIGIIKPVYIVFGFRGFIIMMPRYVIGIIRSKAVKNVPGT